MFVKNPGVYPFPEARPTEKRTEARAGFFFRRIGCENTEPAPVFTVMKTYSWRIAQTSILMRLASRETRDAYSRWEREMYRETLLQAQDVIAQELAHLARDITNT